MDPHSSANAALLIFSHGCCTYFRDIADGLQDYEP